jgi:hypothetical protein
LGPSCIIQEHIKPISATIVPLAFIRARVRLNLHLHRLPEVRACDVREQVKDSGAKQA